MATEVLMPKLGLTMQTGTVNRWLKQVGDAVVAGEPLVEIESEKVTATVDAPAAGILRAITIADGEETPAATLIGYIGTADEPLPASAAPRQRGQVPVAAAPASVASATPRAAEAAPATEGDYAVSPAARKLARELGVDAARVRPRSGKRVTTEDVQAFHAEQQRARNRPVSPAARKLARELGVDITLVPASGARVTSEDVQAYAEQAEQATAAAPAAATAEGGAAVTFYSDGLKLAGVLYRPTGQAADTPAPGVVLCAGIQGVKELGPQDLGQRLAELGFVTLTFDYRGFGGSEGERWTPWPHEQVRDVRHALSFLAQQDGVDPRRLGLVGISMGGGHALTAAAEDERIGAVVAIEPVTSGARWLRDLRREWEWRVFRERLDQDRARRVTGGESARVSLYEIMVPDPETKVVMDALMKLRPGLETEPHFPLACAEALAEYRPDLAVDRISPRAVLFIHGEADVLVAPEHSSVAYAFAGEPSRLEILEGMGHLNWQSPKHPIFGRVADLTREWLKQHLD